VLPHSRWSLASQVLSSTYNSWLEVGIDFLEFGQSSGVKMEYLDQTGPRFEMVEIRESL
jgi:hypothetical protein